jgi:IclR family pca regulon transcriptional regulator
VARGKSNIAGGSSAETRPLPVSEYVQTLEKGLAVIQSFNEATPARTLAEVASAVGLTRAAARRFVLTLEALGYVERSGKSFRLLPKVLDLGYSYLSSQPWWRHAQRVVSGLARDLECGCAAGVLDRDSVAYVAYATGERATNVVRSIGTRLPAHATAMGRVLLAHISDDDLRNILRDNMLDQLTPFTEANTDQFLLELATVRASGYSIVDQQLELGLYSIGIPIRDRAGVVFAGLSASFRRTRMSEDRFGKRHCEALDVASRAITAGLPS